MYVGYVFICTTETLKDCLSDKLFTCSPETGQTAQEVGTGSVIFLLNTDSNVLVGPFTAVGTDRTGLEQERGLRPQTRAIFQQTSWLSGKSCTS